MSTPLEAVQPLQKQQMFLSSRVGYAAMTVARYFLGLAMMPYAIDKLHLQMLLGLFELIPALLLLNVRTRRLGALFMFPVLLNVVLINFALDIGRDTKIISSVFLAINVFLVLYDGPVYLNLFKRLVVSPAPIGSRGLRLPAKIASSTIVVVGIVFSAFAIGFSIVHFQIPVADFTGMPQINGSGTWKVESLSIAGRSVTPDPDSSFFFDVFNTCEYGTIRHASFGTFEASKSRHTFQIKRIRLEGSASAIEGTYQLQGDRLLLSGTRDNVPLSITLKRVYPNTGW
ncbi:MAG TPA: hypothetical protein VGJ30_06455 [Candidatus Angelobacter sp.]